MAADVEAGRLSWQSAVIDRHVLLAERRRAAARRREIPVRQVGRADSARNESLWGRLFAPAVIAIDVAGVVATAVIAPRILAALGLAALVLVGLALARREGDGDDRDALQGPR